MTITRYSSKMIILGALLVILSLLLMFQPLFTWAQELNEDHPCRVSLDPPEGLFELENMNPGDSYTRSVTVTKTGTSDADLYLTWDWVDGNRELGEPGSLFEQLELVISHAGEELYRGPMVGGPRAGDPPSIEDALYVIFLEHGDEVKLDFTVILPGPTTGNEFQNSTLETKLVFYTICTEDPGTPTPPPAPPEEEPEVPDDEEIITPEEPEVVPVEPDQPEEEVVVDPDDPEVVPVEPDQPEEDEPELIVVEPEQPRVEPPLPRTGGASIAILVIGAMLILAGVVLKNKAKVEGSL